jgi:hypothetical protein
MQSRRIATIFASACGLGCLFVLTGCGDDSRTSGSQLQMSPAVKAEIEDMRSAQKEARAERKSATAKKSKN